MLVGGGGVRTHSCFRAADAWAVRRGGLAVACTQPHPPTHNQIAEEMNVAYAWHEIDGDYMTAAIIWWQGQ